jgi:hypothetical protein
MYTCSKFSFELEIMWGAIQLVLKYKTLPCCIIWGGEATCQVTGESMSLGKYEVLGVRMDRQ